MQAATSRADVSARPRYLSAPRPRDLSSPDAGPLDQIAEVCSPRCTLTPLQRLAAIAMILASARGGDPWRVVSAPLGAASIGASEATWWRCVGELRERAVVEVEPTSSSHGRGANGYRLTGAWTGLYVSPASPRASQAEAPGPLTERRGSLPDPDLPPEGRPEHTHRARARVVDLSGVRRGGVEAPPGSSSPPPPVEAPPPHVVAAIVGQLRGLATLAVLATPLVAARLAPHALLVGLPLALEALVQLEDDAAAAVAVGERRSRAHLAALCRKYIQGARGKPAASAPHAKGPAPKPPGLVEHERAKAPPRPPLLADLPATRQASAQLLALLADNPIGREVPPLPKREEPERAPPPPGFRGREIRTPQAGGVPVRQRDGSWALADVPEAA